MIADSRPSIAQAVRLRESRPPPPPPRPGTALVEQGTVPARCRATGCRGRTAWRLEGGGLACVTCDGRIEEGAMAKPNGCRCAACGGPAEAKRGKGGRPKSGPHAGLLVCFGCLQRHRRQLMKGRKAGRGGKAAGGAAPEPRNGAGKGGTEPAPDPSPDRAPADPPRPVAPNPDLALLAAVARDATADRPALRALVEAAVRRLRGA